jgi:hypothetical protein
MEVKLPRVRLHPPIKRGGGKEVERGREGRKGGRGRREKGGRERAKERGRGGA